MKRCIAACIVSLLSAVSAHTPPTQPATGPGGSDYAHGTYTYTKFGTDIADCYWIYEPADPKPESAAVVVVWHGTNDNPDIDKIGSQYRPFCGHICRKGYTVIFPLYQYGGATLEGDAQLNNNGAVLRLALAQLDSGAGRVRPLRNADGEIMIGATGHSRGGGQTVTVAAYHHDLGLPAFAGLCPLAPGQGRDMSGLAPETKIIVVSGDESDNDINSFNLYDKLGHIPCANKAFIRFNSDRYGAPEDSMIADHGGVLSAFPWYGSLKYAVSIMDCAFKGENCEYCLGSDSLVTHQGQWSDGTPVRRATKIDSACGSTAVADAPEAYLPSVGLLVGNGILRLPDVYDAVLIVDLQGRVRSELTEAQQIDCSRFPAGLYVMDIVDKGKSWTVSVIIH